MALAPLNYSNGAIENIPLWMSPNTPIEPIPTPQLTTPGYAIVSPAVALATQATQPRDTRDWSKNDVVRYVYGDGLDGNLPAATAPAAAAQPDVDGVNYGHGRVFGANEVPAASQNPVFVAQEEYPAAGNEAADAGMTARDLLSGYYTDYDSANNAYIAALKKAEDEQNNARRATWGDLLSLVQERQTYKADPATQERKKRQAALNGLLSAFGNIADVITAGGYKRGSTGGIITPRAFAAQTSKLLDEADASRVNEAEKQRKSELEKRLALEKLYANRPIPTNSAAAAALAANREAAKLRMQATENALNRQARVDAANISARARENAANISAGARENVARTNSLARENVATIAANKPSKATGKVPEDWPYMDDSSGKTFYATIPTSKNNPNALSNIREAIEAELAKTDPELNARREILKELSDFQANGGVLSKDFTSSIIGKYLGRKETKEIAKKVLEAYGFKFVQEQVPAVSKPVVSTDTASYSVSSDTASRAASSGTAKKDPGLGELYQ